jgi:acyl-CoA synthetase (AMP-forming)/AMP-acid ligase II
MEMVADMQLQKLAKITHYNFIANVMQACMHESYAKNGRNEIAFGAIPLTHGYGLNIGHIMVYRGDTYVICPRFDMQLMLKTIERFRVERLYVVRILRPREASQANCAGSSNPCGISSEPLPP